MIVLLESLSCDFEKVKSTFLRNSISNILSKNLAKNLAKKFNNIEINNLKNQDNVTDKSKIRDEEENSENNDIKSPRSEIFSTGEVIINPKPNLGQMLS